MKKFFRFAFVFQLAFLFRIVQAEQDFLPTVSLKELDTEKFFQFPKTEVEVNSPINRNRGEAQPVGALSGATIFLSAGHGWMLDDAGNWITQRNNSHGVLEDHSNAETVNQYLLPLLWNAGANVITVRERDMQTNQLIVTEPTKFRYGALEPIKSDTHPELLILETINYTAQPGATEKDDPTTTASYTCKIPEAGYYGVYVWYTTTELGKASSDATFTVSHTGGRTKWVQNLNEESNTWKYLGTYYFEPGNGGLAVGNSSSTAGDYIAIKQVRFGGGTSAVLGESVTPLESTPKPFWELSGLYYATFSGFQTELTGAERTWNQIHAMPRYAEWVASSLHPGRSVFLSWHTNASLDHTSTGISSYIYGKDAWDSVENFSGIPGSERLAFYVHNQVLKDIRREYDSDWTNVGIITRWLGETNPNSNTKTPAMLLENGFHDHPNDAKFILDPRFRQLAAHAAYKGLVQYYNQEVPGFSIATILPEPPQNLAIVQTSEGIKIQWSAPPFDQGDGLLGGKATHYRVYCSGNGFGFDNGVETEQTEFLLKPNRGKFILNYVRVAAVNDGGESLPTETLSLYSVAKPTEKTVLVVNAFDRLDAGLNRVEDSGVQRGILMQMNSRNAPVHLTKALKELSVPHVSTSDEGFLEYDLSQVAEVIWLYGNQVSAADDLPALNKLASFAAAGGKVIFSGSNVAQMPELLLLNGPQEAGSLPTVLRELSDTEAQLQVTEEQVAKLITFSSMKQNRYPAIGIDVFANVPNPILKSAAGPVATFLPGNKTLVVGFPLECFESDSDLKLVLEMLRNSFPK